MPIKIYISIDLDVVLFQRCEYLYCIVLYRTLFVFPDKDHEVETTVLVLGNEWEDFGKKLVFLFSLRERRERARALLFRCFVNFKG